jgi:hypothetical protein
MEMHFHSLSNLRMTATRLAGNEEGKGKGGKGNDHDDECGG